MGTKIRGFVGLFDVLGYSSLIMQNELDKTIEIFKRFMTDLDNQAITLGGQDRNQTTALTPTESLVFSDSIILYQALPSSKQDLSPSFLAKACVLLRLAFERGLPLRGAISFGEVFVDKRIVLGKPIIDAYQAEKKQQWAGVALTPSAETEYKGYEARRQRSHNMTCMGISLNPADMFSPFCPDIVVRTDLPVKKEGKTVSQNGYSLRWDDFIVHYVNLQDMNTLNAGLSRQEIEKNVTRSFSAHGKDVNGDDVSEKMQRTVDFLVDMRDRPLKSVRLTYVA